MRSSLAISAGLDFLGSKIIWICSKNVVTLQNECRTTFFHYNEYNTRFLILEQFPRNGGAT